MEKEKTNILVVSDSKTRNGGNSSQGAENANAYGQKWHVIIKTDIVAQNTLLRPDGYSSVWFENIGEDNATIFDSVPVNPESLVRKFENRPGEIITTQIPVQFEKLSADRRLLVTKIYYERI